MENQKSRQINVNGITVGGGNIGCSSNIISIGSSDMDGDCKKIDGGNMDGGSKMDGGGKMDSGGDIGGSSGANISCGGNLDGGGYMESNGYMDNRGYMTLTGGSCNIDSSNIGSSGNIGIC